MRKKLLARTRQVMPFPMRRLPISLTAMRLQPMGLLPMRLLLGAWRLRGMIRPAVAQDKKTGPAGIHMNLANRPLSEAFQIIEKQAGITFHFDKTVIDPTRTISLNLDNVTLS